MPEKTYNRQLVGAYHAICQTPGCGVLVSMDVYGVQKANPGEDQSTVVTEIDYAPAYSHYNEFHLAPGRGPMVYTYAPS